MSVRLTHLAAAARAGFVAIFVFVAFLAAGALAAARADAVLSARSHHLTVAVVGDSVAHDLARGMERLFEDHPRVRVIRQTKFATGLVRTDYYNWNAVASAFMRMHNPDIVVIVMGGNDKQDIRVHGRRYDPLSKGWIRHYKRRVARFIKHFKRRHTRVYWVGLPPVRSRSLTHAYRVLNRIYAYEAKRHGLHYVSVWDKFTTPHGAYSSFGQSLQGAKRKLRKNDGEHFTDVGRLVFAAYVAKAIGLR